MSKVFTPVLLVFFNRPDTFKKVFEKIREVKPSKLYLFQDGARNRKDEKAILECRKIAEKVDWECDVYKNYQKENLGCGQGPYQAISWVFQHEETAIILEDDCVPDKSFFVFCDELLKKYEKDTRVGMITGLNHFETWDCGSASYLFAKTGANCGWATWKRVWETYDYRLDCFEDEHILHLLKGNFLSKRIENSIITRLLRTRKRILTGEKLSYWDLQFEANKYIYNWLAIVPQKNMISNIGVGEESTHNSRESFFNNMRVYEMKNIVHPQYLIQDTAYDKKYYQFACPNIFIKIRNKLRSMRR